MSHEFRKRAVSNKREASSNEPSSFDVDAWNRAQEEESSSSEHRFESLATPEAVSAIVAATKEFLVQSGLRVMATRKAEEIPMVSGQAEFKYSAHGSGSLAFQKVRIRGGEDVTVSLVWEEELLIGYGIAAAKKGKCEIEIIDVDCYSRRGAGLAGQVEISGQNFSIGVGHIVTLAMLEACASPFFVDATRSSSRYIFKSLGFVQDDSTDNPCILRMG